MSCRQHGYPWPSLAISPDRSSPPADLQCCNPYPHRAAVQKQDDQLEHRAGRPAFEWPYVGVHRSASFMSSSLLLQQCPACLVHLTIYIYMSMDDNIHVCVGACVCVWVGVYVCVWVGVCVMKKDIVTWITCHFILDKLQIYPSIYQSINMFLIDKNRLT